MKEFLKIAFDVAQCRQSLDGFRHLLESQEELEENSDIKPFFEAHLQLSALLGVYSWGYAHMDLVSFQYQLLGTLVVTRSSAIRPARFMASLSGRKPRLAAYFGSKVKKPPRNGQLESSVASVNSSTGSGS